MEKKDYATGKWNIIEHPFRYGKDLWIGNYVHIRPNVTVGDDVEIRDGVWLGPGVKIGSRVKVFNRAVVGTETEIHDDVYVGSHVIFANTNFFRSIASEFQAPIVESHVRIAVGAIILPTVVIREGCIIAAGAVVTKPTEPNKVYMGVPARIVREITEEEQLENRGCLSNKFQDQENWQILFKDGHVQERTFNH